MLFFFRMRSRVASASHFYNLPFLVNSVSTEQTEQMMILVNEEEKHKSFSFSPSRWLKESLTRGGRYLRPYSSSNK
jgi:hypothetical protein